LTARKAKQKSTDRAAGLLRIYLLLPAFEALLAVALIFATPSQSDQTLFLGLSFARWALVAVLFVLGLICATPAWLSWSRPKTWQHIEKNVLAKFQHPFTYSLLIVLAVFLFIGDFFLVLLTFKFTDEYVRTLLLRVFPLVFWLLLVGIQTLILVPQFRYNPRQGRKEAWLPALIALGTFILIGLFMSLTGLGLQPDRTGWENPGVPLLVTQMLMAWLGALLLYGLLRLVERRFGWRFSRRDLLAAVALWLLAIWVWQAQPLTPTFFSPAPRPPNNETYPYSDAANHDLAAQSLLIGEGFTEVAEKPLYSFFLAAIHSVVGQDYSNVASAQVVLLALFPSVLYLVAGQLHHRLSGGLLAIAVTFRESNAIVLSGEINVSHSKLLMTDLPAALGMALFCLLLLRWLQSDWRSLRWALWVGGAVGILMLLRSQIIIFLPLLLVLAFWRGGKNLRERIIYSGLLLLGFALAAVPWMLRNYQQTGQLGYSQPLQALYLAKQYSLTPEEGDPGFPEGTQVSEYVSLGFSNVVTFTRNHPDEVVGFVSAHFFHNEISSLLALPMRLDLADKMVTFYNLRPFWIGQEARLWTECCSLNAYIADTPYWHNWDGAFPGEAWPPLAFTLIMLSIGAFAAWRKVGWLTLIPIGIHIFYNLSTAVARVSGWRLILPVDWVLILFYCLGLGQLTLWVYSYFFKASLAEPGQAALPSKRRQLGWRLQGLPAVAAAILFAGMLLPAVEVVIPARYADLDEATAETEWERSDLAERTGLNVAAFLRQAGARMLWGRALYPRFYPAGAGEPGGDGSAYNILPYARLAFWVVGPENYQIALPMSAAPAFPNATDVLVLGCDGEKTFQAAAVVFLGADAADALAETPEPFICSP
jgi:hypothetical protein